MCQRCSLTREYIAITKSLHPPKADGGFCKKHINNYFTGVVVAVSGWTNV